MQFRYSFRRVKYRAHTHSTLTTYRYVYNQGYTISVAERMVTMTDNLTILKACCITLKLKYTAFVEIQSTEILYYLLKYSISTQKV